MGNPQEIPPLASASEQRLGRCILRGSLLTAGTIFALDAIGKLVGLPPAQLLLDHADWLPSVASGMLNRLNHMSITIESGGGSAMLALDPLIARRRRNPASESNSPLK